MKVVAFNGSGRKDGNTAMMIAEAFKPLQAAGIETEMVQLAGNTIRGCTACYKCVENQDKRCVIGNDIVNDCIEKMIEADGIILASPTYFADVSAELKALIDRSGIVTRVNDNLLARKVGAAIVAVRRGGAIHVYDSINHFFLLSQMIVPGSSYWNIGFGRNIGDVQEDAEGLQTMIDLGENMAWLLGKIAD
ncbi:MAG: flavodoxin family protein [Phycisphaerae bacterium]|jgi:multimeric flavodoxin WrbA|nr:flavodoxin family protein [Phycisphaerae bacterium]